MMRSQRNKLAREGIPKTALFAMVGSSVAVDVAEALFRTLPPLSMRQPGPRFLVTTEGAQSKMEADPFTENMINTSVFFRLGLFTNSNT